jgi:2-polyprenyl-6-methoxyphenol hydroxylase-like FAD-dependent oxidoreductase
MTADILIVGGGIGGAVLAELLGRAGKRVVVLEKSTARPTWTRPEILWPATVETLFSLRPRAEWEREAMLPVRGVRIFTGDGFASPFERRHFEKSGVQPWSTDPNLTREMLLQSSAFELRRGVEVVDVLKEGGRVVGVRARETATGAAFDVLAAWTVGDDGRDSLVRRACGVAMPMQAFPFDVLAFKLDWPAAFEAGCVHGFPNFKGGGCGVAAWGATPLPCGKGAGAVAVLASRFDASPPDAALAGLRSMHPAFDEALAGRVFPADFARLKIRWGHAERYGAPGAVWMGDAAHAVSPAGGQGANMSVADARVLAELLPMNLPSADHPSPALRAPSPLLRGGARDGVRGGQPDSGGEIAGLGGPWTLSRNPGDASAEYERRRRPANERSIRPTRVVAKLLGLPSWSRPSAGLFRWLAGLRWLDFAKVRALRSLAGSFRERA